MRCVLRRAHWCRSGRVLVPSFSSLVATNFFVFSVAFSLSILSDLRLARYLLMTSDHIGFLKVAGVVIAVSGVLGCVVSLVLLCSSVV